MKNPKTVRNLWLFSGFAFLLAAILNLSSNGPITLIILEAIVSIVSFINAYNYHKKFVRGINK